MFTKKLGFNVIDWLRHNYEGPLTLNLYPSKGDSFVSAVLHFKLKTTDEIEHEQGVESDSRRIETTTENPHGVEKPERSRGSLIMQYFRENVSDVLASLLKIGPKPICKIL